MSKITIATSEQPKRLTKKWEIIDGTPQKIHAGEMSQGTVDKVDAPTPSSLADILRKLSSNQALIFGLTDGDQSPVVTKEKLSHAAPGTIARTADAFSWNAGPGWMLLDGDPLPGQDPLTREEWPSLLSNVVPLLRDAPMVWNVSGSSMIFNNETGERITGIRGQRLYILVADARDIPRAGKVLCERLWLAGHGRFIVSKSGQTLQRSPVDASVWQTNRLDFAAPPVCVSPLETRRPDPEAINNDALPLLTSEAVPDLTAAEREQLAAIIESARGCDDLLDEINFARDEWIEKRLAEMSTLSEPAQEEARQRLRDAVENRRLFGDFELVHSTGDRVTVGQLLDNPDRWHGERFHDPLEPDYSNSDKRIAWCNLKSGGVPSIYSHAHGGMRYRLLRPVQVLQLQQGELPQILPKVLERMRLDGEIFERAGLLVRLADGVLVAVEKAWLQTYLESAFQLMMFDGRSESWTVRDCPDKLAQRLLAGRGVWNLPKVGAVVSFPVMRADGRVIDKPGFDEETRLLYLDLASDRPVPKPMDRKALTEALIRIWQPFQQFPFDSDISRGVFLAALLTSVCRPALPTAPAFLIRAYTPGTGKTLLSECLMILVGAGLSALPLPESNAEEIEKRLFAKLLTGCPGLILDNLQGVVDSAAMCAFLTSPEPEGRILGQSETRSVLNRALWLLNGNNVTAGGDAFRRILPVTLDANCESPETRRFTFNPKDLIRQRLDAYRADLLSVLLTYQWEEAPTVESGSFGSFEEWEAVVRQCVCWLIREGVAPAAMVDPLKVMSLSKAEDPHHQQHAAILEAWFELYADNVVQVRDIVRLVTDRQQGLRANESVFVQAVADIKPARGDFDGRYFSGWLRRHKGRVVNGYRLDPGDQKRKESGWLVSKQT